MYPLFLSVFNETWIIWWIFENYTNIKFHENQSIGSRVFSCGWSDTTNLIVAFRKAASAPNNTRSISLKLAKAARPMNCICDTRFCSPNYRTKYHTSCQDQTLGDAVAAVTLLVVRVVIKERVGLEWPQVWKVSVSCFKVWRWHTHKPSGCLISLLLWSFEVSVMS
jgi:hypothetical protein